MFDIGINIATTIPAHATYIHACTNDVINVNKNFKC